MGVRENKITVHCSDEQREDAERQAREAGLNVPNLVRSFFGWPLEKHGHRKDLVTSDAPDNNMLQRSADSVAVKKRRPAKSKASRRAR